MFLVQNILKNDQSTLKTKMPNLYTVNSHEELVELIGQLRWNFIGNTLVFRRQEDAS